MRQAVLLAVREPRQLSRLAWGKEARWRAKVNGPGMELWAV